MINEKINKALNAQINMEYASAYEYLAMSAHFLDLNLNGFAQWMRVQAQEELIHGMKIYDFLDEREGKIELTEIPTPQGTWENPLAVFEDALKNEKAVSKSIYKIVDLALEERDHATNTFMQWFVSEQVEEEASVTRVIDNLKLVGNEGNGLFLLDRDMGEREPRSPDSISEPPTSQ